MISFNRVILTGRVATPPRCSYRPDGSPVIQFPLELDATKDPSSQTWFHADSRPAQNRAGSRPALSRKGSGTPPDRNGSGNLIHIVAIGKLAEFRPDLQSGEHLLVIGRLNQRSWRTPEGKNRTRTEVIATDLRTIEEAASDGCSSKGEMDP